jgi:hypothetical protein
MFSINHSYYTYIVGSIADSDSPVLIYVSICYLHNTLVHDRILLILVYRLSYHISFTFPDYVLHQLHRSTALRLQQAFRPGTIINHQVQIRRYYIFCQRFHVPDIQPSPTQLTLYLEYLTQNLRSPNSVRNYFSAISYLHKHLGLQCAALQSHPVLMMLRAIDNTLRSPVIPKQPVSIALLLKMVQLCNQLGTWGLVLKCALLFCFFGFLRQSNVAPRSAQLFDHTRDTLRSDIQITSQGLIVRLKWTKTHQGSQQPVFIPLPQIQGSSLCPTRAFRQMCAAFPSSTTHTPLLIYSPPGSPHAVVTTRMLAQTFHQLTTRLRLPPSTYTLHSLRRGGATLCHSLGVSLEQIQQHGTWTSGAVWSYLNPHHSQKAHLSNTMAKAILSHNINN